MVASYDEPWPKNSSDEPSSLWSLSLSLRLSLSLLHNNTSQDSVSCLAPSPNLKPYLLISALQDLRYFFS